MHNKNASSASSNGGFSRQMRSSSTSFVKIVDRASLENLLGGGDGDGGGGGQTLLTNASSASSNGGFSRQMRSSSTSFAKIVDRASLENLLGGGDGDGGGGGQTLLTNASSASSNGGFSRQMRSSSTSFAKIVDRASLENLLGGGDGDGGGGGQTLLTNASSASSNGGFSRQMRSSSTSFAKIVDRASLENLLGGGDGGGGGQTLLTTAFDLNHRLHAFRRFQIGDGEENCADWNNKSKVDVGKMSLSSNNAYHAQGASRRRARSSRPRASSTPTDDDTVNKKGELISHKVFMGSRERMKKAIIIGMVYPRRNNHLFHSQREVEAVHQLLTEYHGFLDKDIEILCDRGPYRLPKLEMIMTVIMKIIISAKYGDVLYLHLIGHGNNGKRSGESPYFVTTDGLHLTDIFWEDMFERLEYGVTLFVTLHCCNAGAMMKMAREKRYKGEVIVMTVTGEDSEVFDGYFLKNILTTMVKNGAGMEVQEVFRQMKKSIETIIPSDPKLYCQPTGARTMYLRSSTRFDRSEPLAKRARISAESSDEYQKVNEIEVASWKNRKVWKNRKPLLPKVRTVQVANLSFKVQEAELIELFQNCGEIEYLKLLKDKEQTCIGYGYIQFCTLEGAQNALVNDQQIFLHGRRMRIECSKHKDYLYSKNSNTRALVSGFNQSLRKDQVLISLMFHFSRCLPITSVKVLQNKEGRKYAFVNFATIRGMYRALKLNGTILGRFKLSVELAEHS